MDSCRGRHYVAGVGEPGEGEAFFAVDPIGGGELEPGYREAGAAQIDRAVDAAAEAAPVLAAVPNEQRAALLRRIAEGLVGLGDELVSRVARETALSRTRIEGERARTVLQLEQFAAAAESADWIEPSIDRGDPGRQPVPKPDLRRMNVPLGPVAVFGAGNFPLAYSVAGGDTASALAVGCPVVTKGHPAHPGTCELVGRVITESVRDLALPAGTFSLLHGRSEATGARLVQAPSIAAVGFTGSHRGGRALFDLAARRPSPIPVFAEMGSINPVVVLPGALAARGSEIAERLADSSHLAGGQFCTSPGIVLWCDGEGAETFETTLRARFAAAGASAAVHPTIRRGFERALEEVRGLEARTLAVGGPGGSAATAVCPTLLRATAELVRSHPRLRTEVYGPAMLGVPCDSHGDLLATVESLKGNLTGTVHGDASDFRAFGDVIDALRRRVGRLIANGVPTGVEVCPSMVHGGPYPATTDARFSAVGVTAIRRWVRPVCYQDWPTHALPEALRDDGSKGAPAGRNSS